MKAGIEDGDLRHWTQQFRDNVYAFQFGAIVKWRKNGNAFDRRLDLSGNDRGLEILRTAVDHAVSHNIDIGRAGNRLRLAAPQAMEQALNGFPTRGHRCPVFPGNSARVLYRAFSGVAGPLDLTFPNATRWIGGDRIPNFVETALLAAGAGVENKHIHSIRPSPVTDFRQIVSAFANVLFMLDQFVAQQLFEVASDALQSWNTVHYIPGQVEAIKIVQDRHVERRCRRALLFVAPHMEIVMIVPAISEAVDQPGIAVIGEGEQAIGVGRKVNANDVDFLIYHMIDEAGILMSESIVILPPHVRSQQV